MNLDIILTFTTISFLLVISPGPNGVLFLKTVPMYGKKNGMINLIGILSATYIHGIISFLGLSAIILSSANLFMIIKILGALYLLYLGIKSLQSVLKKDITKKDLENQIIKEKNRKNSVSFIEGFLTQILNPKVSMFYLAVFPHLINFKTANFSEIFILTSIHVSIIFIWFTLFIYLLGKTTKAFESNAIKNIVQSLTGTVFIYLSYKLLNIENIK